MTRRRKIAYCIPALYNSGGMERVLSLKANYLVDNGYDVHIITTDQHGRQPFFPLDPRVTLHDLAIGYEDNNGRGFLSKLLGFPRRYLLHRRRLKSALNAIRPDLTISLFGLESGFLPSIEAGGKKVLEVHFSRFKRLQYGRRGLWQLADRWRFRGDGHAVRKYDRFVVLTQEDLTYWPASDNVCVIPNPRSFSCNQPAELQKKRVVAIGRLCHQKGFDRLIDAWSKVSGRFPDWRLEIYGSGPDREALNEQIRRLGLTASTKVCEPVADVKSLMLNSSILAMTSRYEGLPMAILEAQACGLPTVAMECKCGPRDLLGSSGAGLLVSDGDVEGFATALYSLMDDPELRKQMGNRAFRFSERFSTESVMAQWTRLFDSLLNE